MCQLHQEEHPFQIGVCPSLRAITLMLLSLESIPLFGSSTFFTFLRDEKNRKISQNLKL